MHTMTLQNMMMQQYAVEMPQIQQNAVFAGEESVDCLSIP